MGQARPDLAVDRRRPSGHRLTFTVDDPARAALETEIFDKRVLITDREDWSVAAVVAGYRSQSDAEFSFRQLKDRHVVSFSPMRHWTDDTIRVTGGRPKPVACSPKPPPNETDSLPSSG